ncbi:MAG: hypothetical protein CL878_09985, partial [Dehalococcoidia bacterium]|nr:hypothetical protein [Dehalococcoidia bacterium]
MMMRGAGGMGGGMMGSMSGRRRTSTMDKPEFRTSAWQILKRLAPILAGFRRQLGVALIAVMVASGIQ